MKVPDLIGEVWGVRKWSSVSLDGVGSLRSMHGGWGPGPNRAECRNSAYRLAPVHRAIATGVSHPGSEAKNCPVAPQEDCMCGLYAYHNMMWAGTEHPLLRPIVGIVRGWGEVIVHRTGWRAEYAEVVALMDCVEDTLNLEARMRTRPVMGLIFPDATLPERLDALAARWGVPKVYPGDPLFDKVDKHRVPDSLLPEPQENEELEAWQQWAKRWGTYKKMRDRERGAEG